MMPGDTPSNARDRDVAVLTRLTAAVQCGLVSALADRELADAAGTLERVRAEIWLEIMSRGEGEEMES